MTIKDKGSLKSLQKECSIKSLEAWKKWHFDRDDSNTASLEIEPTQGPTQEAEKEICLRLNEHGVGEQKQKCKWVGVLASPGHTLQKGEKRQCVERSERCTDFNDNEARCKKGLTHQKCTFTKAVGGNFASPSVCLLQDARTPGNAEALVNQFGESNAIDLATSRASAKKAAASPALDDTGALSCAQSGKFTSKARALNTGPNPFLPLDWRLM